MSQFLKDFAILFATIDPIGTVLVFVGITSGLSTAQRRRVAARAVLVGGGILFGFMILGQVLLNAMHIGLQSFQIAGALFLFVFGAKLTFGQDSHASLGPEEGHDIAVYPLALPAIASPGALAAVVVLTNNDLYPIGRQALTGVALLAVLGVSLVMLIAADLTHRLLGKAGAAVLTRVLGLILASLAVELLLQAIEALQFGNPA